MTLFPLPVKAEMSDRLRMPSRVLQFGDGCEEIGLAGLNRQQTTWDVEVIISSAAEDAALNNFLFDHGQHKSFTWQSPRDTAVQLYRIIGEVSSTRRNGGGSKPIFFSRRMQFKSTGVQLIIPPVGVVTFLLRATANGFKDLTGRILSSTNAVISSTAAYGGFSVQITNGYISIPNPNTLISPVGDWTIDFTYRNISTSSYGCIFTLDGSDDPLALYNGSSVSPDIFLMASGPDGVYVNSPLLGPNDNTRFNYYGVKREDGLITTWRNGSLISTTIVPVSSRIGIPATPATLGNNASNYSCNGFYDDFRITNGLARNLTVVPTSKFS